MSNYFVKEGCPSYYFREIFQNFDTICDEKLRFYKERYCIGDNNVIKDMYYKDSKLKCYRSLAP